MSVAHESFETRFALLRDAGKGRVPEGGNEIVLPGLDYLFAYRLARYHGVLPEPGEGE